MYPVKLQNLYRKTNNQERETVSTIAKNFVETVLLYINKYGSHLVYNTIDQSGFNLEIHPERTLDAAGNTRHVKQSFN